MTVSTAARSVTINGEPVSLTNREFDLLMFFLTHSDTVFSREELLKQVWRWDFGDLSTVTVHVKRLRSKLGDHHRVQTVWGRGYLWSGTSAANEFWEIVGWALACSVPVVLAGAIIIRLARSWSLAVSMVALVLIPTLATFTGVLGASGFMVTETFERTAVVLVIVSVVTIPAAVMLARYQARRTVWEQEIRDSERWPSSRDAGWSRSSAMTCAPRWPGSARCRRRSPTAWCPTMKCVYTPKPLSRSRFGSPRWWMTCSRCRRSTQARSSPAFDKVALDEVVDDVLAAHRIAAERAGVLLKAELPEKPVRVLGSDRALVRVLSNLVANAIAHTPAGRQGVAGAGRRRERCVGPRRRHRRWHRRGRPAAGVRRGVPRVQRRVPRSDSSLPSGSGLGLGHRRRFRAGASGHAVGAQPGHGCAIRGAAAAGGLVDSPMRNLTNFSQ